MKVEPLLNMRFYQVNYMYDSDTNTVAGLKTLKQKAIDLLYLLNNKMIETDDMYETIVNFTDGDMKGIADVVPPVPLVET